MPVVFNLKRLIIVLLWLVAVPLAAQQTSMDDIRQLARGGKLDEALKQIDAGLRRDPGERRLRFLKGVILAEKKQTAKAIDVFRKLTVDYPDLPEPYNNLAVLYAGQGDYEKARDALLLAINTHPSYATAHENLGDIYAKMAGVAYDKALSIDTNNATAKHKLALIDELFVSTNGAPVRSAATPEPVAEPATSVALTESPQPRPQPQPTPKPTPKSKPKGQPVVPGLSRTDNEALLRTVKSWVKDWAAQDVDAYLSHYAARFQPDGGLSYSQWREQRRNRLIRPTFIRIKISSPVIHPGSTGGAQVQFVQRYQSNTYQGSARKRLILEKTPQGWKIIREQVLR